MNKEDDYRANLLKSGYLQCDACEQFYRPEEIVEEIDICVYCCGDKEKEYEE